MKDSYVGDIGDFANNGLLRHIFGGPGAPAVDNPLRLGVVSYLNDGAITGYLEGNAPLRECDPGLYKTLQGFVFVFEGVRNRKISTVAYRGMLPDDTIFYDEPLPRARERTADNPWVEGALEEMEDADVVFINPDKGISSDDNHADTEHVSIAELGRFYDKGKSLIIYQHNTQRNGQIEGLAQRLQGWNLTLQRGWPNASRVGTSHCNGYCPGTASLPAST
jgi:hypothetical protein